jgi:predicted O-methyltransferase YrrM
MSLSKNQYSKFRLAFKWFQYIVYASNGRGHGIHSPFVFQFVTEVLNDKRSYYAYSRIEKIKKSLLSDKRMLKVLDVGAGSGSESIKQNLKTVSDIAGGSVSSQKFGRLLFRLVNFYQAVNIIEMGTSLGISAAYMASGNSESKVITVEGSDTIAFEAAETFNILNLNNIHPVIGKFENTLDQIIASNPLSDLVFIDGNHRKTAVMEYFRKFLGNISTSSLIIIHDIHWSREMEDAWCEIKNNPKVKMTIDIFSAGLVFFRDEFYTKQHFTIRF